MHLSHRQRLLQVQQESGLEFIQRLDEPDDIPAFVIPLNPAYSKSTADLGHTATGVNLGLDGLDPILDRYGLLRSGDMIDFHGPSCSGKTLFLYAIIVSNILPKSWKHSKSSPAVSLFGKAKSVVFVDMEQGFSVDQLKSLLCLQIISRLKALKQTESERGAMCNQTQDHTQRRHEQGKHSEIATEPLGTDIDISTPEMRAKVEQLALSCLKNVHVFRPPDAISAIVILRTLDQYLSINTSTTTTATTTPPCALLMIDSLSSFYWQERAQTNHTRYMTALIDALNRLAVRRKLIFVSTTWSLPSANSTTDRTITDALRARLRYRFLMQPKTLERFETDGDLRREWLKRQGRRQCRNLNSITCGSELTPPYTEEDDTSSLFQAQMVISPVEAAQQEFFRFSVSNADGFCSFSVPHFQQ
ncbi:hypothetical protein BC939DRAFT_525824 [Gamsiella multidivaricata]|uniref:uncharacterized protein n=1 Tax=Gamsiella multidivaricata TaxID=101098 RepID=UPI00221E66D1|nr:uncharacterized protein BC939DRAFT_525824 [Gamsiella multidivaricata]KAG0361103.1 hypothetical protein BGZ54_009228 [Gamsiella multidivaricata]KAI7830283.1 hypothetical protein BC939DRAFT_525824 [Gamsiella multidivaricata]